MPPPTNTTPETALALGTLPVASTQDLTGLTPGDKVFYRYTAATGDVVLGGLGNQPVSVYTDTVFTHYLQLTAMPGRFQMPVVPGDPYYFMLNPAPGATVATLTLARAPNLAAPAGSIAINDDAPGYPLAILSAVDGTVLQFRQPFPAGEYAAILPNGRSLWQDGFAADSTFVLYDATLTTPLATLVWPPLPSGTDWVMVTGNRADTFYLGDTGGATARVTTVSDDGVVGPTTWTLPGPGLQAFGVSPDETVLYYGGNASAPTQVLRWDLVGNVALPAFVTVPTGYTLAPEGIVVLADATVILGYRRASPLDSRAEHYSAAGALLHTYPLGAVLLNRLTAAIEDPASFWAWSHLQGADAGQSRFQHLRVSDGAVLVSFTVAQFEEGVSQPLTPGGELYGHSFSCPFILLTPSLPPFGPPVVPPVEPPGGGGGGGGVGGGEPPFNSPSYHVDAHHIRRLRRAPHVANDNLRVFYRRFELDLERGQALASGQGSEPCVLLRLSRDGGQTWGEELRMAAGTLGAYQTRVLARRLGHARDTVFEVVVSDPIAWSLVGAWLDLEPGTS